MTGTSLKSPISGTFTSVIAAIFPLTIELARTVANSLAS